MTDRLKIEPLTPNCGSEITGVRIPDLTDDEVKRVMRSGTFSDGHVVEGSAMPWPVFSNWTEEDLHAVVVYLRHLKPIHHVTPEPVRGRAITIPGAIEQDYGGKDYGTSKAERR